MTFSLTGARRLVFSVALFAACGAIASASRAADASEHLAVKRRFSLPPPAELTYAVKATLRGLTLSGQSQMSWQWQDKHYVIASETQASLFGKIVESKSEGAIDAYGLAPVQMQEKRMRKVPTTTLFKRDSKTISFSESAETYPIKGGEQDRSSVLWQLLSQARAAPDKLAEGAQLTYFVAGRRDAESWIFSVAKHETIQTPLGPQQALHLIKAPPPDSEEQRLDIWLAPSLEWYPVRLRFTDKNGDVIEQTLEKISHK